MQRPLQNSPWHLPGEGGGQRATGWGHRHIRTELTILVPRPRETHPQQGEETAQGERRQDAHVASLAPGGDQPGQKHHHDPPEQRGVTQGGGHVARQGRNGAGTPTVLWSPGQKVELVAKSGVLVAALGSGGRQWHPTIGAEVPRAIINTAGRQETAQPTAASHPPSSGSGHHWPWRAPGPAASQDTAVPGLSRQLEPPSSNTEGPEASRHSKAKSYLCFPSSSTTILGLQHRTIGCEKRQPPCYLYVVLTWVTAGSQL